MFCVVFVFANSSHSKSLVRNVQITGKYINILVSAGGEFKKANTNIFSLARLTREFLFALLFFLLVFVFVYLSKTA